MKEPDPEGRRHGREVPATVRVVARLLLMLHPPSFRGAWGREYLDGARHRWLLEHARRESGALRRTLAVLLRDAAGCLPREWRYELSRLRAPRPGTVGGEPKTRGGTMTTWAGGLRWDVRTAARSVVRRPLLSLMVVGTLGVGIGAHGAIFQVLDQVILRPLPFEGGDRLVYVMERNVERGFTYSATQEEYERWKEASRTLEALEAFQAAGAVLTGRGPASEVEVTRVSHGLLPMIGLRPVLGRGFGPDDAAPDAPAVVMLHEHYWRSAFGADPGVLGRTVVLSDEPRQVVGVWPAAGRIQVDAAPDFFTPLPAGAEVERSNFSILLGRLAPGTTPGEVEEELAALKSTLDGEVGATDGAAEVPRVMAPYAFLGQDLIQGLWILYGGVALLLLVAALNAANLLLDRAVDREGELGVRLALGGSRSRLVRHFLLEGGLLVATAVGVGWLLARAGVTALAGLAPSDLPTEVVTAAGGRLTTYPLALAVVVALVCGLVPALHLRSPRVRRLLSGRDGSAASRPGRVGLRTLLVAAQVAVAVVLVAGTGLTARSLDRLGTIDPGFDAGSLLVLSVRAPRSAYPEEADQKAFFGEVLELVRQAGGVVSASANGVLPLNYTVQNGEPALIGTAADSVPGRFSSSATSSPDFLETLGIPVVRGRDFTLDEMTDGGGADVVLVNEAFARRYGGDVVGRRMGLPGDTIGRVIVGVVGDVRSFGLVDEEDRLQVYYPDDGLSFYGTQRIHVRAADEPAALRARLRERITAFEPDAVLTDARTGEEMVLAQTQEQRFLAVLLAAFGAVTLLLAVIGVYGAVSLQVRRSTHETGIRIALGAGAAEVSRATLGTGLRPVLLGVLVGAGTAAFLTRTIAGLLYQVSPTDPLALAAAVAIPVAAALVACALPARRAVRVDPVEALRSE